MTKLEKRIMIACLIAVSWLVVAQIARNEYKQSCEQVGNGNQMWLECR